MCFGKAWGHATTQNLYFLVGLNTVLNIFYVERWNVNDNAAWKKTGRLKGIKELLITLFKRLKIACWEKSHHIKKFETTCSGYYRTDDQWRLKKYFKKWISLFETLNVRKFGFVTHELKNWTYICY